MRGPNDLIRNVSLSPVSLASMKLLVVVAFWGVGRGTVGAEDMGVEAGSEARTLPDMLDLGAVALELMVSVNLSVGTEIVDFEFWK